jgi:hypothetical protein
MGGHAVCAAAFVCDAACGNCQSPPIANLTLGINTTVPIDTRFNNGTGDMPNTPKYYSLYATEGHTYRIRAFPDTVNKINSMILIVADSFGDPIRRAISNSGAAINTSHTIFIRRTLVRNFPVVGVLIHVHDFLACAKVTDRVELQIQSDLNDQQRDAEMGCAGDTHLSIIFKALHTGEYKVGLAQVVDTVAPRSAFASDLDFGVQWRGGKFGMPMFSGTVFLLPYRHYRS